MKAERAKGRNYFSNVMKQLESISSNNPKAFWDLINKLKDEGMDNSDGLIELSTWKDYFKNLNSIEPSKISLAKSFLEQFKSIRIQENCVLDQDFTLNEVSAACQELKNKKSGGADGLLNEMLKYGQFILLPCFQRLFNYILNSG